MQKDEIDETASKINGRAILADITKPDDVQRLVDSVITEFGRIDILVNNAAREMRFVNESFMTDPKPFWEADADNWQMVINTNANGTYLVEGSGSFFNNRYMDKFLLNRMNSRQGIVKKKQETIFEILIGSMHYLIILLKIRFQYAPVFF